MAKFQHKADAASLRQWLDKRANSLREIRRPFESLWEDIRQHYEPSLGKAINSTLVDLTAANRDDAKIINSSPRILLHRMAAGLQSGITSQARQWFRLRTHDAKLSEHASIRAWLDAATESVGALFARSNVYPALDQIYMHLGAFGTSAAVVAADSEVGMHVSVADEGSYWIAENRRGRVDTLLRRIEMTVAVAVAEFGEGWMPQTVSQKIEQGRLEDRVTVWHLVCPNDGDKRFADIASDRPFASVYWLDGKVPDPEQGILAIRSFGFNPIIAPRWMVAGSAYGIGCGQIGLPDAKQLQTLELDKLKLVEQEADPAVIAPDSMKDEPIYSGPGGITYYPASAGVANGRPPVGRLFDTRQQLVAVLSAIEATEQRLSRTFYSDLFALMINLNMQPKTMTAREVNELSAEKVALLGPILTRLNCDMLDPLVDAGFYLASENGLLPEPPDAMRGMDLRVEYVSSLHMEQVAASRLGGLMRIAEFTGALAAMNPEAVDKFDADQAIDIAAQTLVEHGVVRDDKAVAAIRQARAQAQQQVAQAEAAAQQARAAKDLSEAQLGTGSALDATLAAQGGV